jgi:hypothetical protein
VDASPPSWRAAWKWHTATPTANHHNLDHPDFLLKIGLLPALTAKDGLLAADNHQETTSARPAGREPTSKRMPDDRLPTPPPPIQAYTTADTYNHIRPASRAVAAVPQEEFIDKECQQSSQF